MTHICICDDLFIWLSFVFGSPKRFAPGLNLYWALSIWDGCQCQVRLLFPSLMWNVCRTAVSLCLQWPVKHACLLCFGVISCSTVGRLVGLKVIWGACVLPVKGHTRETNSCSKESKFHCLTYSWSIENKTAYTCEKLHFSILLTRGTFIKEKYTLKACT